MMTVQEAAREAVTVSIEVKKAFEDRAYTCSAETAVALAAALIQANATDRLASAVARLEETIFRTRE